MAEDARKGFARKFLGGVSNGDSELRVRPVPELRMVAAVVVNIKTSSPAGECSDALFTRDNGESWAHARGSDSDGEFFSM